MNVFLANKSTETTNDNLTGRRQLLKRLMLICMVILGSKAFYLQVINRDFYIKKGADNQVAIIELPAHRGMITDRNGNPLAVSTAVETIAIDPKELGSAEPTKDERYLLNQRELKQAKLLKSKLTDRQKAEILAQYQNDKAQSITTMEALLSLPKGRITQVIKENANKRYYLIAKNVEPELAAKIKDLGLLGVITQREFKRFYPTASVSGHLIGFTDEKEIGQAGMEAGYEQRLKGTPGKKKVILDGHRRVIDDVESVQQAISGQNIELSIDQRIQYLAYRELKLAVEANHAKAGTMVILDAKSGEILAAVNQPSFNPNDRSELLENLYRNRAITEVFEPGSTVKPFVVAAALDGHYIGYDEIFHTSGLLQVGSHTVKDIHNYGALDLTGVIKKSSNIAVSQMALRMPAKQLHTVYRNLGFGIKPGSGFQGEAKGLMSDYHRWKDFDRAIHSFGYGFNASALQLARAYTALADDGLLHTVTLLKRDEINVDEPIPVFSPKTARNVRTMMEQVVSKEGTAYEARVEGYSVAGKTGTVKKASANGYAEKSYFSVFAGMIPAKNPRLIAVVMIDEPNAGNYYGGLVSAPVFSKVMTGAMRILAVTPDQQITTPLLLTQKTSD